MEDIRKGKTYQRNPHMATFAKNALKYHGIGSGIVRIISENENIVFENDESGNEFITIIPRQTTKGAVIYEESTQSGTQTCAESTQTDDKSTQMGTQTSRKNTQRGTQTDVESTQRGTQTSRKSTRRGTQSQTRIMVVELIRDNSKISRQEIAAKIGVSEDAVKKHLNKLKRDGVIRREGPDFGGKWIIITDTNKEI